ncbi:MAG: hypothetical protein AAF432_04895 [Planctomycetota bacterium]
MLRSLLLLIPVLAACSPDLRIEAVSTHRDFGSPVVRLDVVNVGSRPAAAEVHVLANDLTELPLGTWRQTTPVIPSGQRHTVEQPLDADDDGNITVVHAIRTIHLSVRALDGRRDGNLDDNRRTIDPGGHIIDGVTDIAFDDRRVTRLRGIEINAATAGMIGCPAGYYQLFEARASRDRSARCIGFAFARGLPGTAPHRLDPFVFSEFILDDRTAETITLVATDLHGNRLEIRIACRPECDDVYDARLNGVPVRVSTQDPATLDIRTCGWSDEPAFGPIRSDLIVLP